MQDARWRPQDGTRHACPPDLLAQPRALSLAQSVWRTNPRAPRKPYNRKFSVKRETSRLRKLFIALGVQQSYIPGSISSKIECELSEGREHPMPLHNTEELKAGPTSQIESEALNDETTSYEFPADKHDSQTVYQTIHDQLILDGNSQQNLATVLTSAPRPVAISA